MKFSELADSFEKLEATTKRLEMFSILSDLFKRAPSGEIDKVVYLCEEQLLPPFRGVEIGMAEKLVARAVAEASGKEVEEVWRLYKKLGDMGLVGEKLAEKQQRPRRALEVSEVYEKLLEIARASGVGSIERKIGLLASLLAAAASKERRYILRFVVGKLRLGVGDPTIMEALSQAVAGDRSLRPEIERAYNLCSDLGLVAKALFEKKERGLREFKVKVGNPVRPALAERLPTVQEIIKKIGRCSVELKVDGFRSQVHKRGAEVEIFSRNLERTTAMFPDIAEAARNDIKAKEAILEGEAVAINEETGELHPFQVTVQRKRKYKIEEMARDFPLILYAFDLIYADGTDYTPEPYEKRRQALERLLKPNGKIRPVERIISDDPEEIGRFFEEAIERGVEGIIAKKLDAPYQAGARNFNWIKLKRSYKGELQDTIDVVVVGYFRGRGARARFGIGAALAAVYDDRADLFCTVTKIGSGLSDENWINLRKLLDGSAMPHKPARVESLIEPDVWVEPNFVFTVRADEITRSPLHTCGKRDTEPGYALRFPRFVGWVREDKKPEDATTVEEIVQLYKSQKKVKAVATAV